MTDEQVLLEMRKHVGRSLSHFQKIALGLGYTVRIIRKKPPMLSTLGEFLANRVNVCVQGDIGHELLMEVRSIG